MSGLEQSILIANRGEPVRRATRTFHKLGCKVIAIAVEEDLRSPWVAEADSVVLVPSYIDMDAIVAAAISSKANGVWPGWGFLSENEIFAKRIEDAGIIWIGPSSSKITMMGSKSEATAQAKASQFRTIPEFVIAGDIPATDTLAQVNAACKEIGFPALLKPALGGGGQGQEVVNSESELASKWQSVHGINARQFRSGPILVQKYFSAARHVEAQVLCDKHGNVLVLGERDCSIQRRNQKVIEEAPCPVFTDEDRKHFIQECTRLVKHIGYDNAGTVECLYSDNKIYFLEMNTRLQVEHTVTEEIARVRGEKMDLVEWMWRIAQGETLPFQQSDVTLVGHAIETRVYAEDPLNNFAPSPGKAYLVRFPRQPDIRVESAMGDSSGEIHPSFDPMIAKIVVHGANRSQAIHKIDQALAQSAILGVPTNLSFCREILAHPEFISGIYDTRFLSKHSTLRGETPKNLGLAFAIAAAIRYTEDLRQLRAQLLSPEHTSLFHVLRQIPSNGARFEAEMFGKTVSLTVSGGPSEIMRVTIDDSIYQFQLKALAQHSWSVLFADGNVFPTWFGQDHLGIQMSVAGDWYRMRLHREGEDNIERDPHAAPMAGQVVAIFVKPGDTVVRDQDLFQIESMKMVTTIRAAGSSQVVAVHKTVGSGVKAGEVVVEIPIEHKALDSNQAVWSKNDFGWIQPQTHYSELQKLEQFFRGFDIAVSEAKDACAKLKSSDPRKHPLTAEFLVTHLREALLHRELILDHAHALAYLIERGHEAHKYLSRDIVQLLDQLMPSYGLQKTADLENNPLVIIRLLQACRNVRDVKEALIIELAGLAAKLDLRHSDLAPLIARGLEIKPNLSSEEKALILNWLRRLDVSVFQKVAAVPVSPDYWDEFNAFNANPACTLTETEHKNFISAVQNNVSEFQDSLSLNALPKHFQNHFNTWFQHFQIRAVELPNALSQNGLQLFELKHKTQDLAQRFVVTAAVSDLNLQFTKQGEPTLPHFERASIEAYRTLRLLQGITPHHPNHVFLISNSSHGIPWKANGHDSQPSALTPTLARNIAARVSGFAHDVRVVATEAILPLLKLDSKALEWTIIEVRHAKPHGLISRPPFAIENRQIEDPSDREREMNENQHRMGKLINPDRAKLLFDGGVYEELKFPEVDDVKDVGLNVYKGLVDGTPTLAYASDFRLRGGALGEREGKKLAATVVLSYLSNHVLVGFHDGAGANIKESIASLGWAGAYFGAIANTGGFSNPTQFCHWLEGHSERAYFEKVLKHFQLQASIQELSQNVTRQLIHFHLHVGATVGMLVYGAAIAHMSLMNDQPESYRVLTGSQAVRRVTGEDATNYELGGAKAHSEESGDIEMIFSSEEKVVEATRQLIHFFYSTTRTAGILRHADFPIQDVPKEAGIILTRDAWRAHLDDGLFFETRSRFKEAMGTLSGYGRLAGQPVALLGATTDYGSFHAKGFKKATQLVLAAQDFQLPLILSCGAQWEAPSQPVAADWLLARVEFSKALAQHKQPKISLAFGPRSIEKKVHEHFDLTVAVLRGNETPFEKERLHRFAPFVVDSMEKAYNTVAQILPYLVSQHHVWKKLAWPTTDKPNRLCTFRLPELLTEHYEMRDVINNIFDEKSFIELWQTDNLPLITGFARLNGQAVGVIADNPSVEAGAQNVKAIAKFTRFNRICARFDIPIIELNDSPAFRPGSEQEHGGIQGEGGKSIREECLSAIPKIAVTLRQNYGGRLIHANLITLGPTRKGLILDGAKIGVMGAKGAVVVLARKMLLALPESERPAAEANWIANYEKVQLNPQKGVDLGYMAPPIAAKDLRMGLIQTFWEMSKL